MSRTTIRYGGAALAGAFVIGSMVQPAIAGTAAMQGARTTPVADAVDSLRQELTDPAAAAALAEAVTEARTAALGASNLAPRLSQLGIPDITATASSHGYAQRDVLVDAAPDMADRDLDFQLQRQDGEAWVTAHSGTTGGGNDTAIAANLPAGTYRVVIPAQHGMAEFVGEPFGHAPRLLSAAVSYSAGNVRTTVDVDPDPNAGGTYRFALESKGSSGWRLVGDFATSDASGRYTFEDLASGTYRVVVPDQADAIGTVSNEVQVTSAADQRAAAAAAAAQAQAQAAAAQAQTQRPSSSSSRPSGGGSTAGTSSSPSSSGGGWQDAPSSGGGGIVGTALAQVGDAYRLGAVGPNAFDCSGLTSYAYRAAGISIPRTAASQYAAATKVSNPRPGDLVFFLNGAQHVGIYLGDGKMVHAANPRRGVEVTRIGSGWYASTFTGFGRF